MREVSRVNRDYPAAGQVRRPRRRRDGLVAEIRSLFRSVEWSLVFTAFLVYVFVILSYRFPVGDIAVAAALLGLLLQRHPLRLPPFLLWFGAFLGWIALGYVQSQYRDVVWLALIDLLKLWLIVLVGVNALRTPAQIRFFMVFVVGLFAIFPIRGALFNYAVYRNTVFGRAIWNYFYSNPNDLAAVIILMLSMAVALLVTERKGWVRVGALASAFVLPVVILLTQSRGGFIGLALAAAIAVASQRRKAGAILAVIALAVVLIIFVPSGAWDRLASIRKVTSVSTLHEADPEGSAESRFAIWRVATRIISDHPLSGVGIGAYPSAHRDYTLYNEEIIHGARGSKDTHSTYLNVLAETGALGLFLFLGMIAAVVYPAEKARRRLKREAPPAAKQVFYLELGLLSFLLAGVFGSFARISFLYLQLILIWTLVQTLQPGGVPTGAVGSPRRTSRRPPAALQRPAPNPADTSCRLAVGRPAEAPTHRRRRGRPADVLL
jgi:probable O-glycosylation ligase (exosortase A-associated)